LIIIEKFKYIYYLISSIIRGGIIMTHNMTVTIEDELWEEMKKHPDVRWSQVMKTAAKEKLRVLFILEKLAKKTKLTEKEIESFAVRLGKKITDRR